MKTHKKIEIKSELTLSLWLKARDWTRTEKEGSSNIYLNSKGKEIARTIFSEGGNSPCEHYISI